MAWGCSVRELLARVDSRELTEWMGFERIEPFGADMDSFRNAQLCATVMNARVGVRNMRIAQARDFMPRSRREMSVDEMISNFKMATGG